MHAHKSTSRSTRLHINFIEIFISSDIDDEMLLLVNVDSRGNEFSIIDAF